VNLTQAEPKLAIAWMRRFISDFIVGDDRISRRRLWIMSATLRETNSWMRLGMRKMIRQSFTRLCLYMQIQSIVLNGT
jgi:hypothetical protein